MTQGGPDGTHQAARRRRQEAHVRVGFAYVAEDARREHERRQHASTRRWRGAVAYVDARMRRRKDAPSQLHHLVFRWMEAHRIQRVERAALSKASAHADVVVRTHRALVVHVADLQCQGRDLRRSRHAARQEAILHHVDRKVRTAVFAFSVEAAVGTEARFANRELHGHFVLLLPHNDRRHLIVDRVHEGAHSEERRGFRFGVRRFDRTVWRWR